MFEGPSLPNDLWLHAMATSPGGGGVILFGGWTSYKGGTGGIQDKILELQFEDNEWTVLDQKMDQPRQNHVVIPIP